MLSVQPHGCPRAAIFWSRRPPQVHGTPQLQTGPPGTGPLLPPRSRPTFRLKPRPRGFTPGAAIAFPAGETVSSPLPLWSATEGRIGAAGRAGMKRVWLMVLLVNGDLSIRRPGFIPGPRVPGVKSDPFFVAPALEPGPNAFSIRHISG
jgi:hypothetical protein